MKKYLSAVNIYERLEDLELEFDEKWLYHFLSHNKNIGVGGLYECSKREMMVYTGIDKTRIHDAFQRLVDLGLVVFDSGLVFIPDTPEEQNLEGKNHWRTHLLNNRREYAKYKSDSPGAPNRAYTAFLKIHEQRFFEIEEDENYDAERNSFKNDRAKKQAKSKKLIENEQFDEESENDICATEQFDEEPENDISASEQFNEESENSISTVEQFKEKQENFSSPREPHLNLNTKYKHKNKEESETYPFTTLEDQGVRGFLPKENFLPAENPPPGELNNESDRLFEQVKRTYATGALGGATDARTRPG